MEVQKSQKGAHLLEINSTNSTSCAMYLDTLQSRFVVTLITIHSNLAFNTFKE